MIIEDERFYRAVLKIPGVKTILERQVDKLFTSNKNKSICIDKKLEDLSLDSGDDSCIISRDENWNNRSIDVSIIVPVYNTGEYLRVCLQSVIAQETTAKYEIIVVNDGSTDEVTLAFLKEYENLEQDNMVIITKANGGLSDARNIGIDKSHGKYLVFVDSDDYISENAIESLYKSAINNNADIVEGAYENVDENGNKIFYKNHSEGVIDAVYGYAWGKMYRASLFFDKQFPKGYWFEDTIIRPMISCCTNRKFGVSECVYYYRRNKQSISFKSQKNYKSLDAYYISMLVYRDRQRISLENDQFYYEELLSHIKLTFRRTLCLPNDYKIVLFNHWCDFILDNFDGFKTSNERMIKLEKAIRKRNYSAYNLWCKANIV
ncbi:glycosyltransferase family 2 protein [Pseudobutyrivibrio sp.]|uniref:glycosyltransferase family 2 protein n=1 Tax=Pseudobutyrivibrio sp. TaxID=2014367 RepID=UPI001B748CA7|nr:glycosyltransferase family 2 protein [Pseudobutyrivibrio sp.]MBP3262322.1 glycosyltransferase family 2 protein [Pseudobutyrivibrio sp.]